MKQMRVLNCTKEDREIIFKIADRVGCPILTATRIATYPFAYPHLAYDELEIFGFNGDGFCAPTVSFSEFITELMKYEKPKVWVTKEIVPLTSYDVGPSDSPIAWCYIPKNSRNHKFTYEIQEEQK